MGYQHRENTLKAIALTVPAARALQLTVEFALGQGKDTVEPIRDGQNRWYTVLAELRL